MKHSARRLYGVKIGVAISGLLLTGVTALPAHATTPPVLDLRVLLIGGGTGDPTTSAWQTTLAGEGVAYTEVQASGSYGAETVTLPTLSAGTTGDFNGVVFADSPSAFAAGQLTALDAYESDFGIRQIDGYAYPNPAAGQTDVSGGALDGTTGTLNAAGLAALPELKGPVPFDTGTYGYPATADAGAPFTPWITNTAGNVLAGVYQHPSGDPQAGVAELALNFDYNASQLQWLLLGPGLVNWVTQDTHLGLYRNYFGQDVDDFFIADNEWSSQYQCTPAATDPVDIGCPLAVQGNAADGPPDVQMSAADVDYVANWEAQTGIKLEFAFNAIGACSAPTAADEPTANCTGSSTVNGTTYTDPGQTVDSSYPDDAGFVNELIKDQSDFDWITHTWSHLFLGCNVWEPLPVSGAVVGTSGGTLTAGGYDYEVTAATAYGESEPSTPVAATVAADGTVTLNWADATNGGGLTLWQEENEFSGGSGFWGYNVYRAPAGSTAFGLVGQVAENPTGGTADYSFTDTGATAPGAAPGTTDTYPTATDPGIECAGTGGADWVPAAGTDVEDSINQQIGLDDAFAQANGLTNWSPDAVVTGEHSGLESPNMPTAFTDMGITVFGADGSRQPNPYTIAGASSAPRYPSNIYYNASNWPDELNEYNTLYVEPGVSIGNSTYPSETGRCAATSATTCLAAPATESSVLASESHIILSHVLANDPRVGYAHQTNLIGPATETVGGQSVDYGYTLLSLINSMLTQYQSWYTAPLSQIDDTTGSQALAEQSAWASTQTAGTVSGTVQNGVVTIASTGTSAANVPVTVPPGTTVNGSAFGSSYGGTLSEWLPLGAGATTTLTENVAPAITSAATADSIVGAALSFTVDATGEPAPALTETGALPGAITFTDNGNGTASLAGTAAAGTGGSYPITIKATSSAGTVTQAFTLVNAQAPTITSPATAAFSTGIAGTYSVTTTGYPAPTVTETGALPAGLTFTAAANGTATIAGTPASGTAGTYHVSVAATNSSGSTSTLALVITVSTSAAPTITNTASGYFTYDQSGAIAVTTTGSPVPAITETGALPAGLTFVDEGTGTALLSGTPTIAGVTVVTFKATNAIGSATQAYTINVDRTPAFTSAATETGTILSPLTFNITTAGYPVPTVTETGTLPAGLHFTAGTGGTAQITGTPTTIGTTTVTLTATSSLGTATQSLKFTINPPLLLLSTVRLAGGVAIQTAVAISGYDFAATGHASGHLIQAQAVVLTRSDEFYDALAGSALAAQKKAPLLLTPTASLDPSTQAEIQRILPTTSQIYLLGGTSAISPAVATQLSNLGYHNQIRLAGGDEYATAVAIDQAISSAPTKVIIATGTEYYDALAAGAAAGATPGTVVVLSDDTTIPAVSATYLNGLHPTDAYGAGGPGQTALTTAISAKQINWAVGVTLHNDAGAVATDTALLIAQDFFPHPSTVALATDAGWYDALTGGAAAGLNGGPLLLTGPDSLLPADSTYITTESKAGFLSTALILGGTSALSDTVYNDTVAALQ
jgi:hypothetical protein